MYFYSKMLNIITILVLFLLPILSYQYEEECPRFCPEDLHASVFNQRMKERVLLIQRSLTAALDGMELLQGRTSDMSDSVKEKLGVKINAEVFDSLRVALADLIEHLLRADKRAWNRIIDTHADIIDKRRSPQAPKDLPDLKEEIENLDKTVKESEESFEHFLKELGSNLKKTFSPLIVVVENLLKMGGEELVLEKMKEKVDNFMGKLLLKLVENKSQKTKRALPRLLGNVGKLTEKLSYDFYVLGLKVKLSEFWKMEQKTLEDYLAHITVDEDQEADDVTFIVDIINKYGE